MAEVQGKGSFPQCASKRILGKNAEAGKSAGQGGPRCSPKEPQLRCPECGSSKLYRDGMRYLSNGEAVQRWLCRVCSYRFSEKRLLNPKRPLKNNLNGYLKARKGISSSRQVCVLARGAKNLDSETRHEIAQREGTKPDKATAKGILAQFMAYIESQGYIKDSDGEHTYVKLIRLLIRKGANILDPEDVKKVIAQQQSWKNGVKRMVVCAYDVLTKVLKITWTPPEYRQEDTLPFIPDEKELDALIIGARSRRMTAFLQTLKETFADPSEALGLRWIDLDSQNNTITINRPVRRHNARQLKVSSKLVALLNSLPKTSERIFPTSYTNIAACFQQLKRKVAHNQQNPRILSISFTTFRHWGATMTYHYTKKILLVKELLGHKRIENTMKYTHLVKFKDSDFDVETAATVDQAKELLKVGYDYIAEKNGIMLFRRPKRFGSLGVISES